MTTKSIAKPTRAKARSAAAGSIPQSVWRTAKGLVDRIWDGIEGVTCNDLEYRYRPAPASRTDLERAIVLMAEAADLLEGIAERESPLYSEYCMRMDIKTGNTVEAGGMAS
jgi:hypothetical protein